MRPFTPSKTLNACCSAESTRKLRSSKASHGTVGSRLRYVVIKPVQATISAVVNSLSAPRAISLLNHALGVTVEQHVTFGPDLQGGTRVRVTMDPIGESTELPEATIDEALKFLTRDALDTVVALCNENEGRNSSASGM